MSPAAKANAAGASQPHCCQPSCWFEALSLQAHPLHLVVAGLAAVAADAAVAAAVAAVAAALEPRPQMPVAELLEAHPLAAFAVT